MLSITRITAKPARPMPHHLTTPPNPFPTGTRAFVNRLFGWSPIPARRGLDSSSGKPDANRPHASGDSTQRAEQLLHGIKQVIDYSRSTAAWPGNPPRVVDLGAVLAHLQDEFAATAIGKGIGLTIQLPDRALDPWADPAAVSHLLTQIVGNAVHTTGHGRVTVAATATATEVRIAIADTRAGSAATALTAAHGAIDQTTPAPARVQGGFGLGLAIAHQLNNVPGGRIEVTSPPDQGTTVTLTLPLARPRVATHTSPATSTPPMRPRGPGLLSELPAIFIRPSVDDRVQDPRR